MKIVTEKDFHRTVQAIRGRAQEEYTGFWFNLIQHEDCQFIQGSVLEEGSPRGVLRNIAFVPDHVSAGDIRGFWPEIPGHPVTRSEESLLVKYLSTRHPNDVELIVPERNTARPVEWDIFENAREFGIYRDYIYPEIIGAVRKIVFRNASNENGPRKERSGTATLERGRSKRLLDLGCGCGNLIEAIQEYFDKERESRGHGKDIEIDGEEVSPFQCYGIDISDENVEAARHKDLENIFEGDSERIDEILPPGVTFDLILFCGLLNRQVIPAKEKAFSILHKAVERLDPGGYVIMTGYTSCSLTAEDLSHAGIEVLQKSLPGNLFRDYHEYFLRQLYVGRKRNQASSAESS